MISKICPNVPKIIEREADLPEGMTHEDLKETLYPNLLALAWIFARHELREQEKNSRGL